MDDFALTGAGDTLERFGDLVDPVHLSELQLAHSYPDYDVDMDNRYMTTEDSMLSVPPGAISPNQAPMDFGCIGPPSDSSTMIIPTSELSASGQQRAMSEPYAHLSLDKAAVQRKSATPSATPGTAPGTIPRYDPKTLLAPRSRTQNTGSTVRSPEPSEQQNGVDAGVSGFSMLERLNQVGDREPSLTHRKRQHVDDESTNDQPKAKINGFSKGGQLGSYITEKRKELEQKDGASAAPLPESTSVVPAETSAPVVFDLTGDDDDDEVIFVSDNNDKEVCIGLLEGARLLASIVPTPKTKHFSGSSKMWPPIKIHEFRRDPATLVIKVIDASYRIVGNIDYSTANVLAPLMDSHRQNSLRVIGAIRPRPKKGGPDDTPGNPTSQSLDLWVVLFCKRKMAKPLGNYLSQKNLWLRDPPPSLYTGFELENPHAAPRPKPKEEDEEEEGGSRFRVSAADSGAATRTVEEVRNDVQNLFDSLKNTEDLPEMDAHPDITTELLTHQKQGLWFLTDREKDHGYLADSDGDATDFSLWRTRMTKQGTEIYYNVISGHESARRPPPSLGGILADMMGLGKTLSILSLVVSTREAASQFASRTPPRSPQRMLRCNLKATLLVAPMSTIVNWEEQIKQHVKAKKLSYYIHHGTKKLKTTEALKKYDIVITNYQTLAGEYSRAGSIKPLADAHWFRIVLDEAHQIRNKGTKMFEGCANIIAERRWAVTGTPVQNKLDDLGALLSFLRVKPFDNTANFNQFILAPCKAADPDILPKLRLLVDSITLRRLKDRIDLPERHDLIEYLEFSEEERKLYEVFLRDSNRKIRAVTDSGRLGGKSYAHVLRAILRMRQICAHGRELLSEEDVKMAAGISAAHAIELLDDDAEEEDKPALTVKQALEMLYLLRESDYDRCNLCNKKIGHNAVVNNGPVENSSSSEEQENDTIGHMTPCYQIICPDCIGKFNELVAPLVHQDGNMTCPLCSSYVKFDVFNLKQSAIDADQAARARIRQNPRLAKQLGHYYGPHTKTKALVRYLHEFDAWSRDNPDEAPIKSVVFSGWTSHLDLIQMALEAESLTSVRLDGSMSRKQRTESLRAFAEDPTVRIILVTIGAGGLGLNLTTANKAFVMEPQYNPAAEAQAVDRVHRLGQRRDVTITRFIMQDSFETKMLDIQNQKKHLADLALDRSKAGSYSKQDLAIKKLEELRGLFR